MKILLLFLFPLIAFTDAAKQSSIYSTNNGEVKFRSDAPLELIKAESKELKGAIDISKKTFAFRIRIRSFEGFNSPLQKEHFNENYMESVKFPEAFFNGKIIEDVDFNTPGNYSIRAKGKMTVHGVEQERIIKSDIVVKNGAINLKSDFSILLSDHNIPIPKVVSEKLANEIKVEVSAEMNARS